MTLSHTSLTLICVALCGLAVACNEPDTPSNDADMTTTLADMPDDMDNSPELDAAPDLPGSIPDMDAAPDLRADAGEPDMPGIDMPDAAPDLGVEDMADMPSELPDLEPLRAAIEQDIANNNASAASVAIWHQGRIIWVGGFGQTDEGRVPDAQTQFMIGSDSKKLTSLAFLKQVERGMATQETTIGSQLPNLSFQYAPNYTGATAHDLMSNQGGLVDHTGEYSNSTNDEDLLSYVTGQLPGVTYELAPPGIFYNYSNPSFSMVGLMTQQIDGRFWADLMRDDLFVPMGMTRTVGRKSEVDDNRATGVGISSFMDQTTEPVSFVDTWENAFVRPAGLIWSTPTDQMKLARFLVEGDAQILRDDLRALISTPHTPTYPDLPGSYGYGLSLGDGVRIGAAYYDTPVWSHGGNTLTHTSTFYVLPEHQFAISILSNGLGDDFTGSIVAAVSTLVDLPEPGTPPEVVFDAQGIDALTGSYEDPFNVGRVILTREGDAMRINMPDLPASIPYETMLTPISTRVWVANIQNTEFVLQFFDGPGRTMYMANRAFVAKRTPSIIIGLSKPFIFSQERFDSTIQRERLVRPDRLLRPW